MNKRKALTLLLSLAILLSLALPAATARADDGGIGEDNGDINELGTEIDGLKLDKTAVYNEERGCYTITLEAYATGEKTTTVVSKDIPTDIILLLDQSGSMSNTFSTATEDSWLSYGKQQNSTNYNLRMNNNNWNAEKNLYYKLSDGGYVGVSVARTSEEVQKYVSYSDARNGNCYFNQKNLYANTEEGYKKITLTRTNKNGTYTYTYTYTLNDGTEVKQESTHQYGKPPYEIYRTETSYEYTYEYYYTLNQVKKVIGTKSKGADTIFDVEFYQYVPSGTSITRQEALLSTVRSFLNAVSEKAKGTDGAYGTDDDVNHRIAVVKFTDNAMDLTNGLVDMDAADGLTTVVRAVNSLSTGGNTKPSTALDMANSIFKDNPVESGERNRVVILFTDGYPAESNTDCINYTWCDDAINSAYTSKETYGATVYTVGIYDGANPDSDINTNFEYGNRDKNTLNTKQLVAANRYMHYTSSNYPNAQSLQNGGERTGSGYYLSAADMDSLNSIFQQISNNIETGGSSTTLTDSTVIRDIVAQAFTMPENTSDVKVYTEDSNGSVNSWVNRQEFKLSDGSSPVSIDTVNRTVSVTGFSYKDNWCGNETINGQQTFHNGKKLIIEFTVQPKAGFLGGNDVFTNDGAGIYENAESKDPLLEFNKPTVNVPIKDIAVTAPDKNVYLLGGVTLAELQNDTTVTVGGIKLDLSQANNADKPYGLEPWQTAYVTITAKFKDKNGNEITGDLSSLVNDKEYTVEVTVEPSNLNPVSTQGETAVAKTGSTTGKINVFKPVLTYKDSEAYYGDVAPTDYSGNLVSTEWKHGETLSTTVIMTGDEPTLGMTYTPEAGKINSLNKIDTKEDIGVDVAVTVNSNEVESSLITFVHQNCEGKTCTPPEGKEFLLHVKTCQLTITKTGGAANESYVFDVYKDGIKYSEVAIWGNSSQTIYELPVGTYTIKENTGWSWRYTPSYSGGVTLDAQNHEDTITCSNAHGDNYKWLNGFSTIVRNILDFTSTLATDTAGNN